MGENPKNISELCSDEFYAKSRLSNIVFPDGRRMDEALTNHPLAPDHTSLTKVGKFYTGKQVIDFYQSVCLNLFASVDFEEKLSDAAEKLSHAKIIEERANRDLDQAKLIKKEASETLNLARDQAKIMLEEFVRGHPTQCGNIAQAMSSGVYFLFYRGDLVYVGQSVCILARVGQHKDKQFDRFAFINCDQSQLNDVEGFFINLLRPRLNQARNGVYIGPRSRISSFDDLSLMLSDCAPT